MGVLHVIYRTLGDRPLPSRIMIKGRCPRCSCTTEVAPLITAHRCATDGSHARVCGATNCFRPSRPQTASANSVETWSGWSRHPSRHTAGRSSRNLARRAYRYGADSGWGRPARVMRRKHCEWQIEGAQGRRETAQGPAGTEAEG